MPQNSRIIWQPMGRNELNSGSESSVEFVKTLFGFFWVLARISTLILHNFLGRFEGSN